MPILYCALLQSQSPDQPGHRIERAELHNLGLSVGELLEVDGQATGLGHVSAVEQ